MNMKQFQISILALLLTACDAAQIPDTFVQADHQPAIYPDYAEVTVPVNIAPLTFELEDSCDDVVARFSFEGEEIVYGNEMVVHVVLLAGPHSPGRVGHRFADAEKAREGVGDFRFARGAGAD